MADGGQELVFYPGGILQIAVGCFQLSNALLLLRKLRMKALQPMLKLF